MTSNTETITARRVLMHAIAAHLAGWTVREKEGEEYLGYRFGLYDSDGRHIAIETSRERGKLHISGYWPRPNSVNVPQLTPRDVREASPEIRVSDTKTPEQIARDITRRFLPDYIRVWDKLAALDAENVAYRDRRAANWQRIAASGLVDVRTHKAESADIRMKGRDGRTSYDAGYGEVTMSSEDSVTLELKSLPVATALLVLRALKGDK